LRIVSPLLKRVIYPAVHYSRLLEGMQPEGACVVVNYHGVIPPDHSGDEPSLDANLVEPEVFRRQLQFLKRRYRIISPEDFRAFVEQGTALPPRAVLITCDDGLLNTLTDMLPLLRDEGVSCLFFVTAVSCGDKPGMLWYEELYHLMRIEPLNEQESQLLPEETASSSPESFQSEWWVIVRRASRLNLGARTDWMALLRRRRGPATAIRSERRWRLLDGTELKRLAESGMSIGAHTISHPVLSLCSDEESRHEIQTSKANIERVLGRTVWAFAYPYGDFSTMGEREVRLAKESGFSCAFLNIPNGPIDRANPFMLSRTHVTLDMSLPEFAAHVSGLHARLQRAVRG
jgi:peptidoglycan/xylan/chitin deacetylase (PgdA/CDA1 family)